MEEFEAGMPIDSLCHKGSVLVAGGYVLDEGRRSGRVYLYDLESMGELGSIETSGTLDTKVSGDTVYLANSRDVAGMHLGSMETARVGTGDINTYVGVADGMVLVADVGGRIGMYSKEMRHLKDVQAAEAPIWVVEAMGSSVVYGSEDGEVRFVDVRGWSEQSRMSRGSGVTSIYEEGQYVYIGSYDEHVEVVDRRMYEVVRRVQVGGGVWRICGGRQGLYMSCMYEGMKVCNRDLEVVERYATGSIAYGLAVTEHKVFFTSFYDRKIYGVWVRGSRGEQGVCGEET